jgi:hypothetical protein
MIAPNKRRGYGPHCQPLEVRFWSKVKADTTSPNGCWLWTGGVDGWGYACIWHQGKSRIASRVAWELRHANPFPEGMQACHTCDNPRCVRPDHIFPGTNMDNHLDALRKGRLVQLPPRTHCQRGHAMEGDNVAMEGGKRRCRTCRQASERARRARQKSAPRGTP